MKKALVILILLALVGGGLFAQTLTVATNIEGGFAVVENGADEMSFSGVAPDFGWVNGAVARFQFDYVNAQGNAGYRLRFQTNAANAGAWNAGLLMHNAWGWIRLFDNMVEFRGGRIWEDQLSSNDPWGFGWSLPGHTYGVTSYIRPIGNLLTIGLGGYSNGEGIWEEAALRFLLGFAVNFDMGNFRTQLFINDGGRDGAGVEDAMHAQVTLSLTPVADIPVFVGARINNLNEFGDYGVMRFYAHVGFNGIQDLALGVGGAFGIASWDDADPFMGFGAWMTFDLGVVMPRLDLYFVNGGEYRYAAGLNPAAEIIDDGSMTFWADQSYLNIRPALQFRVSPNNYFQIGGIFNIDLGDVSAVGRYDGETGVTWGAFVTTRISLPYTF